MFTVAPSKSSDVHANRDHDDSAGATLASFSRCPKMSAVTSIRKIKQLGRTQIPDKSVVHSRLHNLSLPTD